MNKYRKKPVIALQLGSIVLVALLVAGSARAQTLAPESATDDGSDATDPVSFVSSLSLSFAASGLHPMPATGVRRSMNKAIAKEFGKAWCISGAGTTGREGVVLIFRMEDGSYTGRSQGFTNQYAKFTFRWNPAALAIVHTHPNDTDPKPTEQDKRVADKYGVPNFTISTRGMYVYDPATKKTSKVLNGLDWLYPSTYQR
jgi:hypothetical protein